MASEAQLDSDVETLGAALGEAIAELPEYEAFEAAEEAVAQSSEAQARIDAFESAREEFMLARQTGSATQEDMHQLRSLQAELYELSVMQRYAEAQEALDERLAAVNEAVSAQLAVDFAGQAGACCHD